ncbi:MAG: hypothetical protein F4137_11240 [Acidobacteria bacterium]|nr:hypothetical protein [Acidobacteriota bacterium]MYH29406.1 hypothetical protein [Acidobacteriota bacterium]
MHDHDPHPKKWREKIGEREHELEETRLDVFDSVSLWAHNPRLRPVLSAEGIHSDADLEGHLEGSKGYDVLHRSIRDHGQMEHVYVWRDNPKDKYLVLEGATRVTILRDLARRAKGTPDVDRYRYVKAKCLPADFSKEERVILLARIHVRGTGVRSWGRYVEAQFVHDSVDSANGAAPLMSVSDLARYMGKSVSWVTRLRDAYTFASKFVDYVDTPDAEQLARDQFSTLEEIAKSTGFGPMVRDYTSSDSEQLRAEVFDMVRNNVFQEYRDARFMKQFHDDPEKWAQLKTHQENIASKLALEERKGAGNLAAKIAALPKQVQRALEQSPDALDESAIDYLDRAARVIEERLAGASLFRMRLQALTKALSNATLANIKDLQEDEYRDFDEAFGDLRDRLKKHAPWGQSL